MAWHPDLDGKNPVLYKALAERLEADIRSGALRPGERLPPQRELADKLGINLSTVTKAFKLCELKGLLSATVGRGTCVAYDAMTDSRLLSTGLKSGVIDMGPTAPDDSGNEILLSMLRELTTESDSSRLFSYFVPGADDWHKDTAVRLFAFLGHETSKERILFSNGGQNALSAVLPAVFRRGDKIAADAHTYPGIKTAAAMYGVQLLPVPQDECGMDPEALELLCRSETVRGIYLIPACQNPTTVTMPKARRREIAKIARDHELTVIEDSTYQFMSEVRPAFSDFAPERSICIASLSKAIAPGLRLAYLSAAPQYHKRLSAALYSLNVAVVPLMSELAARIIASGKFEEILKRHLEYAQKADGIIAGWLPPSVCLGGKTAIFRWLKLPLGQSGADFEREALERGVQVYGAERFAVGGTVPERAVRLSVCSPKTLEKLDEGCKILAALLNEKA